MYSLKETAASCVPTCSIASDCTAGSYRCGAAPPAVVVAAKAGDEGRARDVAPMAVVTRPRRVRAPEVLGETRSAVALQKKARRVVRLAITGPTEIL